MKQLLFILTLLIGTCFATHAKTIKLVPSALDSTRMDTVVISDLQDVNEDQNAAMHDISSDFGDWNSGPPTSVAIVALIICCGLPFFIVAIVLWFGSIPLGTDRRRRIGSYRIPYFLYGVGTSIDSLHYHSTQKEKR